MTTIYDAGPEDIAEELIGKTIVEVDEQESTITLSDGAVLEFEDTVDCCAWFFAELTSGNLTDNAITSVVCENVEGDKRGADWVSDNWILHVLAADKNVVDINVYGDEASGFYCHSIILNIRNKCGQGNGPNE